jgi:hypothetical protein
MYYVDSGCLKMTCPSFQVKSWALFCTLSDSLHKTLDSLMKPLISPFNSRKGFITLVLALVLSIL